VSALCVSKIQDAGDLRPLARRYLGKEMGDRYVEETRNLPTHTDNVLIRMRPERWLTTDYSKE
jgi:hypothetical protein